MNRASTFRHLCLAGVHARRVVRVATAVVLLVGLLSGCGSGGDHRGSNEARSGPSSGLGDASTTPGSDTVGIPVGTSTQMIEVNGTARIFHLYRPTTLSAPAAPLVVMLHGGFGSGIQAERSYKWDHQADQAHILVAYPDGLNHAWNTGGGCCGKPARDNVDDVAFISDMIVAIEHQIPVETHRIYASGISNGGIMAYALACRTTLFAAIGADSATQLGDCTQPAPVSVIHIHGTADQRIPYNGDQGSGVARIDGPSAPALDATWRTTDQCAPPTTSTTGPLTTSTATCPAGRVVELITIAGAGHQWPGAAPSTPRLPSADPPSTALDATQTIWQFFSQQQ